MLCSSSVCLNKFILKSKSFWTTLLYGPQLLVHEWVHTWYTFIIWHYVCASCTHSLYDIMYVHHVHIHHMTIMYTFIIWHVCSSCTHSLYDMYFYHVHMHHIYYITYMFIMYTFKGLYLSKIPHIHFCYTFWYSCHIFMLTIINLRSRLVLHSYT